MTDEKDQERFQDDIGSAEQASPETEREENASSASSGSEAQGSVDEVAQLTKQLEAEKARADEYYQRLLRTQADFDNFRRRARQEREELFKYAGEGLIVHLLPVLDNLERAIAAATTSDEGKNLVTGVEMVYRQFKDVLEREGLTPIAAVGLEFDPTKHEAVLQVETEEHPDNTVLEELQTGYQLKDKVIRPTLVKVAKNTSMKSEGENNG